MSEAYEKYLVAASTSGGKFWEVKVVENEMMTRNGKVGQDKKWSTKEFPTPEKALKSAKSKVKAKLKKVYAETERRPMEITDGFKDVDLSTIPLLGEFYFRALERFPGGNADMFTVKVNILSIPGEDLKLSAKSHHDWDGEHWVYPEKVLEKADIIEKLPDLLESAKKLINSGLNDSNFTVLDKRVDSDEYNTEWSVLEFSLFALNEESKKLIDSKMILRLFQRAVYNGREANLPDKDSQKFMDTVHDLVGITRPEQYSEGDDVFSKLYKVEGESLGYKDYPEVPPYL